MHTNANVWQAPAALTPLSEIPVYEGYDKVPAFNQMNKTERRRFSRVVHSATRDLAEDIQKSPIQKVVLRPDPMGQGIRWKPLESEEEAVYVTQLADDYAMNPWLGLSDAATEASWEWVDTCPSDYYGH